MSPDDPNSDPCPLVYTMDVGETILIRLSVTLLICTAVLAVPTICWSKSQVVEIIIDGDQLSSPIEITSPDIIGQFNIWNGPGVSTSGPDGVPHPPAYLDPDKTTGRFIDWPRGIATNLSSGMQRLEVTFHIGDAKHPDQYGKYPFAYEIDSTSLRGYIFLSRWGGSYISHGVEGNWFHASERWDKLIIPIIREASENASELGDIV